jgi:hypothetical protein
VAGAAAVGLLIDGRDSGGQTSPMAGTVAAGRQGLGIGQASSVEDLEQRVGCGPASRRRRWPAVTDTRDAGVGTQAAKDGWVGGDRSRRQRSTVAAVGVRQR